MTDITIAYDGDHQNAFATTTGGAVVFFSTATDNTE